MKLGDIAAAFGKGIFAGVTGTAAMTLSSTMEMKVRGRPASYTPALAAVKVLGLEPVDEEARERFSDLVHWGYGTAWGGARGLLAAAGLSGRAATAAHLGAVWGSEQVMLPALGGHASAHRVGSKGGCHRCTAPPGVHGSYRSGLFIARQVKQVNEQVRESAISRAFPHLYGGPV